jgi:hypothetical protein
VRALLVVALALTLIGCSRQPSPLASETSCDSADGPACAERRAAGTPVQLASFRPHSTTAHAKTMQAKTHAKSVHAETVHAKTVHARTMHAGTAHANMMQDNASRIARRADPSADRPRAGIYLAAKRAKPAAGRERIAPAFRVPLPPSHAPKTPSSQAASVASASVDPSRFDVADARGATEGVAKSESRTIEQQVADATAAAERATVSAAPPAPQSKASRENIAAAPPNTDLLVAVVMARPDVKSVSDLTRKTIAIDERYSASSGNVRTAIVAAGAPEVQVSEEPMTAINRLTGGEVPAAVVALVSPDAADTFPEIAGLKLFRVPLSPKSERAKP